MIIQKFYMDKSMKKIINFLSSVKLSIIVVSLIILMSFIGGIISDRSVETISHLGIVSLFFDPNSHEFFEFASKYGLLNVYNTPLFIGLTIIFFINLLCCTIKLIPFAVKGYSDLNKEDLTSEIKTNKTEEEVKNFLHHLGYKINDKNGIIRADKFKAGRFGVIILHSGILITLLGAAIGYLGGFKAYVPIFEGTSVESVTVDNKTIPLGFSIFIDKFDIEFYEDTRTAKSFASKIIISEGDKKTAEAVINTNSPMKYKDISLYQTNFGEEPNSAMKFDINVTYKDKPYNFRMKVGDSKKLDNDYLMVLDDFSPSLFVDQEGKVVTDTNQLVNPAVAIAIYDSNGEGIIKGWLPIRLQEPIKIPELNLSMQFKSIYGAVWTGLSLKSDPGLPVVYLGFVLMCFGVLFIYTFSYTTISFIVKNSVIYYNIRTQRRFAFIDTKDSFYKFING